ncbi:chemotaxis protein CheA [Sinimarinibacterium thermocellulolyticum]|uniref:histidine kinase n=1 Tax=Sinimarinibacterium thermocellulolyticum TaxID=3170016 RepID=A0ABV2ACX5_9GAMM
MSSDDDIRADFLVEAGELVQTLGAQLVELESRPQDQALLNAIFRAFHTVKGGAGFLELHPLVELCHAAEDVFNALRSGKRGVDPVLMDVVLAAVDAVQTMMQSVAAGTPLAPADPALLQSLRALLSSAPEAAPATAPAPKKKAAAKPKKKASAPAPASDTITEEEFEALLDQLHGSGKGPAAPQLAPAASAPPPGSSPKPASASTSVKPQCEHKARPDAQTPSAVAAAQSLTHAGEGSKPPAETTVRVDTARLDALMNLVGELVLVRNRLKDLRARQADAAQFARPVAELDLITRGLQNAVMQVRMQPVGKVFARFPKIARDVARSLGKQVEVELVGEDTDLDKNLVEALADPLVHMVRNSVDHGIELPEERLRRGKPVAGHLTLSAQQQGDSIAITVRDDGAGIDAERVRAKAVENGLVDAVQAAQMSTDECLQLVFLPGFSTKEQVSDLSGRGVGMDVVMSRIRALGGSVRIESQLGVGSTVHIRVPLTLAILSALMVSANGRRYALPLAPVLDVFALEPGAAETLDRWDVVLTRCDTLRLVWLDPWLARPADDRCRHVVVAQVGDERFGFVVGEVRGREEIVIKPLGPSLRGTPGISSATVLPDGHVALILDFAGLVEAWRHRLARQREPVHG